MAAKELFHKSGVKVMILIFPNQHVKVDMLSEVSNTRQHYTGKGWGFYRWECFFFTLVPPEISHQKIPASVSC